MSLITQENNKSKNQDRLDVNHTPATFRLYGYYRLFG